MAFKKWTAMALFGGALCLAGPLVPGFAFAQNYPSRTLVIASPAAGASVSSPFTVSIGLADSGSGAAGSGGSAMGGQHHHGGQAYLVIDSPLPAAGDTITADAKHIAFPPGQRQLSVSLPAGQHQLQIVAANHEGEVSSRVQPSTPLTITVQ
jgi:hypothetical protein